MRVNVCSIRKFSVAVASTTAQWLGRLDWLVDFPPHFINVTLGFQFSANQATEEFGLFRSGYYLSFYRDVEVLSVVISSRENHILGFMPVEHECVRFAPLSYCLQVALHLPLEF